MQNVRYELERWYARFPDWDGDLRSRFRGADHSSDGAFFELLLCEILARLGLSVAVQPTLEDGTRPDFLSSTVQVWGRVRWSTRHSGDDDAELGSGGLRSARRGHRARRVRDARRPSNAGTCQGLR